MFDMAVVQAVLVALMGQELPEAPVDQLEHLVVLVVLGVQEVQEVHQEAQLVAADNCIAYSRR